MVKKENANNKLFIFAIVIVLLSITGFVISLTMNAFAVLHEEGIPIAVRIDNYTAYNISKNQKVLHLGTIKTESFGERNLSISNSYDFKTSYEFDITGDIEPLMIYPRVVVLEPMETREVVFRTKVIEYEDFGTYSGIIHVKVRRVA